MHVQVRHRLQCRNHSIYLQGITCKTFSVTRLSKNSVTSEMFVLKSCRVQTNVEISSLRLN